MWGLSKTRYIQKRIKNEISSKMAFHKSQQSMEQYYEYPAFGPGLSFLCPNPRKAKSSLREITSYKLLNSYFPLCHL